MPEHRGELRQNGTAVISSFAFTAEARRILYTTNAIESLDGRVRRSARDRESSPKNYQVAT